MKKYLWKVGAFKKTIQHLYTGWVGVVFAILMLVFGLFIIFPILISRKLDVISFFFARLWVYSFSLLSGIRLVSHNRSTVDRNKSYIFVINHTSFLDAPAIPIVIPSTLVVLEKKELSQIPVFGWIMNRFIVWIDRCHSCLPVTRSPC